MTDSFTKLPIWLRAALVCAIVFLGFSAREFLSSDAGSTHVVGAFRQPDFGTLPRQCSSLKNRLAKVEGLLRKFGSKATAPKPRHEDDDEEEADCPECDCPKCPKCTEGGESSRVMVAAPPPAPDLGAAVEGQITMTTDYGKALYSLMKQDDVQLVLEVGTWKGGGSSLVIAKGLKDSSGFLITMEGFEEFYLQAKRTLAGYPVKCILGTAVEVDALAPKEHVRETGLLKMHDKAWPSWWDQDKQMLEYFEVGLLKEFCRKRKFDAIHLDGGEFTGVAEFDITKKYCKPKYIMLHDCNAFKNYEVRERVRKGKEGYKIIKENPDGVGWAILERED